MKSAVILTVCGILISLVQTEIILTDEQKAKLSEHHKACTVASRDSEFLNALLTGELVNDQPFKEYLYCISKRIGFQNEAGEVQKQLIAEKLKQSIKDPAKAEEYTETCLKQNSNDSPTETVYKVVDCLNKITPNASILSS